jgi:acetyl-CoA carboxylase biotin carboxyl carrier protein
MGINAGVLKEIKTLFQETSVEEIELEEQESFYIRVSRKKQFQQVAAAPVVQTVNAAAPVAVHEAPQAVAAAPAASADQYADESKYHKVKSPVIGTYYASPAPGANAFVKVGDTVSPDTTVCIVEAMKVMNEIKATRREKSFALSSRTATPCFPASLFSLSNYNH